MPRDYRYLYLTKRSKRNWMMRATFVIFIICLCLKFLPMEKINTCHLKSKSVSVLWMDQCPSDASLDNGHMKPFGHQNYVRKNVDTVDVMPSFEVMYKQYMRPGVPVLIKKGATDWPAFRKWRSDNYLQNQLGDVKVRVEERKVFDVFNPWPVQKVIKFAEFLRQYKTEEVYLDSKVYDHNMLKDFMLPRVIACANVVPSITNMDLLMSSGNTSSVIHMDSSENFLSVLSGQKKILLADPSFIRHFYADDYDVSLGLSPVDAQAVDLNKFPLVRQIDLYEVTVNAGDIFYLPDGWWHQSRSYGCPNIAVNIWMSLFQSPTDSDAMLKMAGQVVHQVQDSVLLREGAPKDHECQEALPAGTTMDDVVHILKAKKLGTEFSPIVPMPMNRTTKLKSGYSMPMLGFGTALLNESTEIAVSRALKIGYRMFDTAQGYPDSEEQIGRALKRSSIPREALFIVTKLHPRYFGYMATYKAVKESLRRLQTDYIDLFLIHSLTCDDFLLKCNEGEPEGTWETSWRAMERLQRAGKIRSLGVSNFEPKDLEKLLYFTSTPVSVVQDWFDPFHRNADLRNICTSNGIAFMGYSTLGEVWNLEFDKKDLVLNNKHLWEVASSHKVPVASAVLNWAMRKGVTVIPRSSNPAHMLTNFQALDFKMSDMEVNFIDDVLEEIPLSPDGPES